ncbi:hypothetical protein CXG81DRAFT_18830 [Caulochytrium protostelioides]|uniref:Thiolase n=1 Tax=Caulochytrium protostelioides TaxID=1555241 RepID=A0A4P9X7W9_9FUNG|nr:hypothetical protein CXG81DRAFT_18830 [Caulochytrium protostelioides]|eukprot:RKP01356.1 hypothetical protein CXG81DRAFT_18830 [Caulochytrium protostelioides]
MSSKLGKDVFIVAAKRTPWGSFGGKLAHLSGNDLGGLASKAAVAQVGKPIPIDSVIYGNVLQTSRDAAYLARHVGHHAGVDITKPALTINRLCGSGFQSVINAAQEIQLGEAKIVLAGGSESMSQAPFAMRGTRSGIRYGQEPVLEDTLASALIDTFPTKTPMGITAENLAEKYSITRQDADAYALRSQQNWAAAQAEGRFAQEITPVSVKVKRETVSMDVDEYPRPKTTLETLAKLAPAFKKDGTATAGNSSGICDGAASLIVASGDAVKAHGLTPLARIVSYAYVGVEPTIMGIGPVPAVKLALKRAQLSLKDMGVKELNEAFASQALAVLRELGEDVSEWNTSGGSIAMGHPLGASGARILAHLTYELQRRQVPYALGTACIGGGQGIAVILERC